MLRSYSRSGAVASTIRLAAFLVMLVVGVLAVPTPALAQGGAVRGTVEDQEGRAIKGAVIRASSPGAGSGVLTTTSNAKGHFALIGLSSGVWSFEAEAPGYVTQQNGTRVRQVLSGNPDVGFVLPRQVTVPVSLLGKSIQADVADADALRTAGQLEPALAAYLALADKNPALTSLYLVIGDTYRRQAAQATGVAARTSLLDKAVAAFDRAARDESLTARARTELAATEALRR